jgi:cellulase
VNLTLIDTWANEWAADKGNSHSFQIPSDIKPGTYVMRTELIALHGNAKAVQGGPVSGPEFYVHCFNIDVIGSGTATPAGVTFPGGYKPGDKGLYSSPYIADGSGIDKYVSQL